MGVLANLVFAAGWLLVQPLTAGRHQDWVILVGTYFSSWVLADVTTTNLLGNDHYRVLEAVFGGVPTWRILLIKNLALLAIVGLPTLGTATALTLWLETPARLAITIPTVAVPIVSWLGVGNLISVLHPVGVEPLFRRRRDRRRTRGWLLGLSLPYALYYIADPMNGVDHRVLWYKGTGVDLAGVRARHEKLCTSRHRRSGLASRNCCSLVWVRKRGLQIR